MYVVVHCTLFWGDDNICLGRVLSGEVIFAVFRAVFIVGSSGGSSSFSLRRGGVVFGHFFFHV